MPKAPRLAEEGRIRTTEEYLAWADAVTRDAEDIFESVDYGRWKAHVTAKYHFSPDEAAADRQLAALWDKGLTRRYTVLPLAGIGFTKRVTPRGSWLQYRDPTTGRFIATDDAMSRISAWEELRKGL